MTQAASVWSGRINLAGARVLVLERSKTGLAILVQILEGFGVHDFHKCLTVAEARAAIESDEIDLVILDPTIADGEGYEFVGWVRRSNSEPNCHAPIILVTGHTQESNVRRGINAGASYFVVKPITPSVLLERILWIAREDRFFVETDDYAGPDRRALMGAGAHGDVLAGEGRDSGRRQGEEAAPARPGEATWEMAS